MANLIVGADMFRLGEELYGCDIPAFRCCVQWVCILVLKSGGADFNG